MLCWKPSSIMVNRCFVVLNMFDCCHAALMLISCLGPLILGIESSFLWVPKIRGDFSPSATMVSISQQRGECDCGNCSILFEQCPVGFMLFRRWASPGRYHTGAHVEPLKMWTAQSLKSWLVCGLAHFLFFPIIPIDSIDFHIFQRGRLNHQPDGCRIQVHLHQSGDLGPQHTLAPCFCTMI